MGVLVSYFISYNNKNQEKKIKKNKVFIGFLKRYLLVIQGIILIICCSVIEEIRIEELINKVSLFFQMHYIYINNTNINIGYSIDGISVIFIFLTIILIISCMLINWNIVEEKNGKEFQILLLIIELLLINFFGATDIIQFYILYEAVLIPIVLMIGIWGSRTEKKIAAYQILIYTLVGSIFMCMSILYIYYSFGTTDYIIVKELIEILPRNIQEMIFIGFFVGFAVKIPIVPLHLWLLRAHVESPTVGSVILAGILLKLGGYGYLRYNVGLFPELCNYFYPIIGGICLISILYTGIATLTQLDIKRIIAYSSISHMNVAVLGLFTGTLQGIEGSIFLMVSHGVVSGGLFLCIGAIYERFKTRVLYAFSNVIHVMPIMSIYFFLLILANIAFPITSSFAGELITFIGLAKKNIIVAFFSALSMIVTVIYSFWLFNRLFYYITNEKEIEKVEFVKEYSHASVNGIQVSKNIQEDFNLIKLNIKTIIKNNNQNVKEALKIIIKNKKIKKSMIVKMLKALIISKYVVILYNKYEVAIINPLKKIQYRINLMSKHRLPNYVVGKIKDFLIVIQLKNLQKVNIFNYVIKDELKMGFKEINLSSLLKAILEIAIKDKFMLIETSKKKQENKKIMEKVKYSDINKAESLSIGYMIVWMIILGIQPIIITKIIETNVLELLIK